MDKQWIIDNVDEKYRDFVTPLTVTKLKIYGVRIPVIKKYAKEQAKKLDNLKIVKPDCFEEAMFEGILIATSKLDINEKFILVEQFLPYIDNWSVCDSLCASLKDTKKDMDFVLSKIYEFMQSDNPFTIRVGLVLLNDYFVQEKYLNDIFEILINIKNDKYYVKMAESWLLSTCFIKFPDITYKFMKTDTKLNRFIFNKAIQKISDSYRVSKVEKEKVKKLKK